MARILALGNHTRRTENQSQCFEFRAVQVLPIFYFKLQPADNIVGSTVDLLLSVPLSALTWFGSRRQLISHLFRVNSANDSHPGHVKPSGSGRGRLPSPHQLPPPPLSLHTHTNSILPHQQQGVVKSSLIDVAIWSKS